MSDARPHPWAWWGWALGIAAAASLGTNPLLNLLIAFGVVAVVLTRRTNDPWARSVGAYFALASMVLLVRLAFAVLVNGTGGEIVLFTLPSLPLPAWAAGIRLGGPVSAEPLLYVTYDSLRLGLMLVCLGAANALANPKRALKAVPAALYEASVALVIALSVAPQLVESTIRVRRARRLRGGADRGLRATTSLVIPVLSDAIDRSLALAAGMEARGFGRTRHEAAPSRLGGVGLVLAMMALILGGFWLLAGGPLAACAGLLAAGAVGVTVGLRAAGARSHVTRYRPDPWTPRDTGLVLAGLVAASVAALAASAWDPDLFAVWHPSTSPPQWPSLHLAMVPVLAGVLAPLALSRAPQPPTKDAA